ncbi:hypothetical protein PPYR_01762 [Photinus pyralis]|uniref:BZIP domain-containing protein n=2 Tax=Photinus pyralis TaxID=7054 RepID=A0A1Y1N5E2_PHOPY|nr:transcription factor atf1 [Photinus pyralis]KAB0804792.1 hypothetical protein PPYR_01762 [Photinus pyralis]
MNECSDKLLSSTNEHHNNKRTLGLQLGIGGDSNSDDQTPTPTRFIRNCEEVGLFQDLQDVNPFEETFRKAATDLATHGSLHLPPVASKDESLHTPHIFPHIPQEGVKYSNSDDEFSLNDDILVIDESEIHQSTTTQSIVPQVTNSTNETVRVPGQVEGAAKKVVGKKRVVHLQKQRELNRAAQVRSRAKKKVMFHTLVEEVSLLKSQTKELAKENERLRREVVWLKTMLMYHKDCPVAKDPRIMEEVEKLRRKKAQHSVPTVLVPVQSNQSSQLTQLVALQPITAGVLLKIPNAPKPIIPKLAPLRPKGAHCTVASGVSNGTLNGIKAEKMY